MQKRVKIFSAAAIMLLLCSCGRMGAVKKYIEKIEVNVEFSEATADGDDIGAYADDVYRMQLELCDAMARAYDATDIENLPKEYPAKKKAKVVSELNLKRQEIYSWLTSQFAMRMIEMIDGVEDCTNKENYVEKRAEEVSAFRTDYAEINGRADSKSLADILIKHTDSDNSFARRYLTENKEKLVEAAVEAIEYNASQTTGLRALVVKNNSIVSALDSIFETIKKSDANRINDANKKLIISLLNSMETLSAEEKKRLTRQLESGEDMTIEIERTRQD